MDLSVLVFELFLFSANEFVDLLAIKDFHIFAESVAIYQLILFAVVVRRICWHFAASFFSRNSEGFYASEAWVCSFIFCTLDFTSRTMGEFNAGFCLIEGFSFWAHSNAILFSPWHALFFGKFDWVRFTLVSLNWLIIEVFSFNTFTSRVRLSALASSVDILIFIADFFLSDGFPCNTVFHMWSDRVWCAFGTELLYFFELSLFAFLFDFNQCLLCGFNFAFCLSDHLLDFSFLFMQLLNFELSWFDDFCDFVSLNCISNELFLVFQNFELIFFFLQGFRQNIHLLSIFLENFFTIDDDDFIFACLVNLSGWFIDLFDFFFELFNLVGVFLGDLFHLGLLSLNGLDFNRDISALRLVFLDLNRVSFN